MAKINEFGEIIREEADTTIKDSAIPTFTPPKVEISHENKGDDILHTGKYEYKGTKYDLRTLENLAQRLEEEIRSGKDEMFYSEEVLTIAMQMLKKAQLEILKSSQVTPAKERRLAQIQDKQVSLQKDGILLSAETLLRNPEKAQEYIMALQGEMAKQKEIDTKRQMKEIREFSSKMPNISSKPASVDIDER
mgnify:CR=1 FL=1